MEQQEIDRIKTECERITREFRDKVSQKPALDENGKPRLVDEMDDNNQKTGKKCQLYTIKNEEIYQYLRQINAVTLNSTQVQTFIDLTCLDIQDNFIFRGQSIKCGVDLSYSVFHQRFEILNTEFHNIVLFNNVDFNEGIRISEHTKFYNFVQFSNVNIFALEIKSVPEIINDFSDVYFFSTLKFNKVFFENIQLKSVSFEGTLLFINCIFKSSPIIDNTILPKSVSFENPGFLSCETLSDYVRYRILKESMNKVHAKHEENMFFALEQRTRRYLDAQDMRKNWPIVTVSYLYDSISSYGQDLLKPVLWLVCTWYAFAGVFSFSGMVGVSDKLKGTWFESIFLGFGYSTQNIFNPLSAVNFLNIDRAFYPYNPVIAFLGWFEAILSVAFITLWLLAVRRRFQKGE